VSLFSYPIGREAPIYKRLTDTNYAELLTAGNNGATIVALSVNEINGSTPTIILELRNASGTVVGLRANARALAAKENWQAITLAGVPIVLLPSYSLYAKASAGNQIDIDGVYIDPPQRN
jgi:hypothetical protein